MSHDQTVRIVNVSLDSKDLENDAIRLFKAIRPSWRRENIQTKVYSAGFLNKLVRFHESGDTELNDAIVIRVFGDIFSDELVARNKEFAAMQLGQAAGCFPRIEAGFDNGVAYKYIRGRMFTVKDLNDPVIGRELARTIAQFHMVDTNNVPLKDLKGNKTSFEEVFCSENYRDELLRLTETFPETVEDSQANKILQACRDPVNGIYSDLQWVFSVLDEINLQCCINHGDMQIRNMIYDPDTGHVFLLDYEFSAVRYQLGELVDMFGFAPWLTKLGIISADDNFFPFEIRSMYLKAYLERLWELKGRDLKTITDDVIERASVEVEMLTALNALVNIVYGFKIANNPGFAMDSTTVIPHYAEQWRTRKQNLLELKEKYLKLSTTIEASNN